MTSNGKRALLTSFAGSDNWVTSTENFVNGSFNSIYNWAFSDTVIGNNNTIIGGGLTSNGYNGRNNNITGSNNTLSNNTVRAFVTALCTRLLSATAHTKAGRRSNSLRLQATTWLARCFV